MLKNIKQCPIWVLSTAFLLSFTLEGPRLSGTSQPFASGFFVKSSPTLVVHDIPFKLKITNISKSINKNFETNLKLT